MPASCRPDLAGLREWPAHRGAMGTGREGSGGPGPLASGWLEGSCRSCRACCLRAESGAWRNELLAPWAQAATPSPRGVGGEEEAATFHLQPVQHGAAVHHIQHRPAGPQAGKDLEDKGRWGVRGCRDSWSPPVWAAGMRGGAGQNQPPANRSHHLCPLRATYQDCPPGRGPGLPQGHRGSRVEGRAPCTDTWGDTVSAPTWHLPPPVLDHVGKNHPPPRILVQLVYTPNPQHRHPSLLTRSPDNPRG